MNNVTQLAKQLGISRQILHRYINRGCPTDSVESAMKWRNENLDVTQTKSWRIDGNHGVNRKPQSSQVNETTKAIQPHEVERIVNERTVSRVISDRYFDRADWLAIALKEAGVNVTGKQVIEIQDSLFSVFMDEIIYGCFQIDSDFELPPLFEMRTDSEEHKSRIAELDKLLGDYAAQNDE